MSPPAVFPFSVTWSHHSPRLSVPFLQFLIKVKTSLSEQFFSPHLNNQDHLLSPEPCNNILITPLLATLNLECPDFFARFCFNLAPHPWFYYTEIPFPCPSTLPQCQGMSTCSVTFFPLGHWFPTWLLLFRCLTSLQFPLFFWFFSPTVDFNFLLLYYLFHFHPQSLALTNTLFQSSLPVPLFPQPAIQAATIFNLASHPMPHSLLPCAIPWSPRPPKATFNLLMYEKNRVFSRFFGPFKKVAIKHIEEKRPLRSKIWTWLDKNRSQQWF